MKSSAATVDDFLGEQPDHLRMDLIQLRSIVRSEIPEAVEAMRYGGPAYSLEGGSLLCGFTAQKNNLAFYVGRVPDELRDMMKAAGFSLGKGAVRFKKLDSRKVDVLRALLREVLAKGITC